MVVEDGTPGYILKLASNCDKERRNLRGIFKDWQRAVTEGDRTRGIYFHVSSLSAQYYQVKINL